MSSKKPKDNHKSKDVNRSKPEGMGLGRQSSKGVRKGPGNTNGSSDSGRAERGKQAADGAKNISEGAMKASEGAGRAAQGAGRLSHGDVSGAKDVAKGAKDSVKGAKQSLDGVNDVKKSMGKDSGKLDDKGAESAGMGLDRSDPYDPANYESLFDDDDEKSPDSDSSDNKAENKDANKSVYGDKPKGMKDLMDDDKSEDDSEDDSDTDDKDSDDDSNSDPKKMAENMGKLEAIKQSVQAYVSMQALMKFLELVFLMAQKAIALATGLWSAITGFASMVGTALVNGAAAIGSFFGAGMAAGAAVMASTGVAVVSVAVVALAPIFSTNNQLKDETLVCLPSDVSVSADTIDWADGDLSARQRESIQKAWSVFSEMGVSREVAAGILGNFSHESGVDPTGVETIYDEPYQIGSRKLQAMADGFDVKKVDPAYGKKFPGVKLVGIGLGQWSNGRNTQLLDYASARGLDWYDIGTQLAFMFDEDSGKDVLMKIANTDDINVTQAMERFLYEWERPAASAAAASHNARLSSALTIYIELDSMTVDSAYAESIISQMNGDTASGNHHRAQIRQDDGCGETVGSHEGVADGTGVFPAGITGTRWSPATLPAELKQFTYDPADAGLAYSGANGWINNGYPGQCVALSQSYMAKLYGVAPFSGYNGKDVAKGWYKKYKDKLGGSLIDVPQAGAVFEHKNGGEYGHTGVVQHVFANGDMLVVEQNVNGISGDNNNTPYTWGWGYHPQSDYAVEGGRTYDWQFYKPDAEPMWNGSNS